jgi:hypothetical protein
MMDTLPRLDVGYEITGIYFVIMLPRHAMGGKPNKSTESDGDKGKKGQKQNLTRGPLGAHP